MEYVHPIPSTPHSKFLFFISDFLLGPSLPETMDTTNPAANKTVIKLECNLTDQIA
jgi:hypothetical protein